MLKIKLEPIEYFNDQSNTFFCYPEKEIELQLEHSLVSISKWEAKWHKPFLSTDNKTNEELMDYVRCMSVNPNIDLEVFTHIPNEQMQKIMKYIEDPMTATTFTNTKRPGTKKIVTNEVIYYLMVSYGIPFECQKWHLNRLMTLIRVCAEKNAPQKKMSQKEIMSRNRALNQARRAQLNSRG